MRTINAFKSVYRFWKSMGVVPAFIVSLVILSMAILIQPGSAQSGLTNVGTLSCTLDPGSGFKTGEPRAVECKFAPVSGPVARYEGAMRQVGDEATTADRLVLIWAVFASDSDIRANALDGRFKGSIVDAGGEHPTRVGLMISVSDPSIQLHPLVELPDSQPENALLILELDLKQIRA